MRDTTRGQTLIPVAGNPKMARALVLALCFVAAHGLGGTTIRECPKDAVAGYEVNNYSEDCFKLGDACFTFDGGPGVCIQVIWTDYIVDGEPPVSTSA